MQKLLEEISEGVLILRYDGRILYYNQSFLNRINLRENGESKSIESIVENQEIAQEIMNGRIQGKCLIPFKSSEQETYNYQCKIQSVQWEKQSAIGILVFEKQGECTKYDLETLLMNIPCSVWIRDREGRFVFLNDGIRNYYYNNLKRFDCRQMVGYTLQEGLKYFTHLEDIHIYENGEEVPIFKKDGYISSDCEVIESKSIKFFEEKIEKAQGHQGDIWLKVCKIPILDKEGNVKFVASIKRDITAEKNLSQDIIDSQRQFESLKDMNGIGEENEKDSFQILQNSKKQIMQQLMADGLAIGVYNQNKEELEFKVREGIYNQKSVGVDHIAIKKELFNRILHRKEIWGIRTMDERDTTRFNFVLQMLDVRNVGVYPIQYEGRLIGILLALYQKERKMLHFIEDSFIYTICDKISCVLENTNLTTELQAKWFDRKKAEEELQCFLEISADLVVMINQEGEMIQCSQGWKTLLGWTEEEIKNHKWMEFVHPEDSKKVNKSVSLISGNKEGITVRYKKKDGTYCLLCWKGKFMKNQGVAFVVASDVTIEKEREKQRIAYETAVQKEQLKNEFLGNVSHEFKTPINIILAGIQLIQAELADFEDEKSAVVERINKHTVAIYQNGYRLLRLVNNIIELTKMDSGFLRANLVNVDIISLVEDVALSTVNYLAQKQIELVFDTEVEELVTACDPVKMESIMLNLLSNSVKYMERSGTVFVWIAVKDQQVMIHVKDNGVGIPKKKLNNIFERFVQVNDSIVRKTEGSGLGLAIVKSLVTVQKGTIQVESTEGVGTEFIISLPIWQVEGQKKESVNLEGELTERCKIEFSDIYSG